MKMTRWQGGLALLGLSLTAAGSFTGCGKVEHSRGGLMLLVSKDGPVPIDRVDITIVASDRSLLENKYRVPEELALPTSVAIVSNGDSTAQATISVTGWSGSVPVDRRDAIVTQIPNDRVVALNVVLSARCTNKLSVASDGNAVSNCGDGNTCDNAGQCVPIVILAQDLPTYRAGDENDAGSAGAPPDDSWGESGGESGAFGGATPSTVGSAGSNEGGAGGTDDGGAAGAAGASFATCGDHHVDPGEACDDGGESTRCNADCTVARCGDSVLNATAGEQCDDSNTQSADGCSSVCKSENCGNTRLDPGEVCDDGNTLAGDGCSADCRSTESCGNGTLDPGEGCDDGNGILTDNCVDQKPNSCQLAVCGDGFVDQAAPRIEECDDRGESNTCNRDCTKARCQDSILNITAGEDCDDGKETARCNADCKFARCGDHVLNATAGEQCDTGALQTATCEATCTTPRCGDLIKNVGVGEQCDDGGVQTSVCEANCKAARCGDSIRNAAAGEDCDTGAQTATCEVTCKSPRCGDGIVNTKAGEQCEPPNTTGCSASCKTL